MEEIIVSKKLAGRHEDGHEDVAILRAKKASASIVVKPH
jgi:hypothetical protein